MPHFSCNSSQERYNSSKSVPQEGDCIGRPYNSATQGSEPRHTARRPAADDLGLRLLAAAAQPVEPARSSRPDRIALEVLTTVPPKAPTPATPLDALQQTIWDCVSWQPLRNLWNLQGVPVRVIAKRTWNSLLNDNQFRGGKPD